MTNLGKSPPPRETETSDSAPGPSAQTLGEPSSSRPRKGGVFQPWGWAGPDPPKLWREPTWAGQPSQPRSGQSDPSKARSTSPEAQARKPGGSRTSTKGAGRRGGDKCRPGSVSDECPQPHARAPREGGGQGTRGTGLDRAAPHSAPGLSGSQLGPLTVMAAPRDAAGDSRAGLRGAPSPPPLSAAGRFSSSPSLPRSCPGPFHPPIKLFFFFKLPGRTREGQWEAWKPGQTAAGAARGPMGARAGPRGRGLRDGAGGWGGGQGGPGSGRPLAGRKGQRAGDSAGDSAGAGRPELTAGAENLNRRRPPHPAPQRPNVGCTRPWCRGCKANGVQRPVLTTQGAPLVFCRVGIRTPHRPEKGGSFVSVLPRRTQWFKVVGPTCPRSHGVGPRVREMGQIEF